MGAKPGVVEQSRIARSGRYSAFLFAALLFLVATFWFTTRSRLAPTVVGTTLAALLVADWRGARKNLDRLEVGMAGPVRAQVGAPIDFRLHIDNVGRPVRLVQPGSTTAHSYVIDRSGWTELHLPPAPRGIQRFLYIDLISRGSFGLIEQRRRYRCWLDPHVAVAPAPLGQPVSWPPRHAAVTGQANATIRGEDLFRSIREYQRGDPKRSVHWPSSARHGALMVQERDGQGTFHIRLVVHTPVAGPAAEACLGRALWLGLDVLRRGWTVELVTIEPAWGAAPPQRLVRATGVLPRSVSGAGPMRVVTGNVDELALRERTARAAFGPIPPPPGGPLTRVISPLGDLWL